MPAKAYEILTIAKILKMLKKDYKEFDAYKLGIIDAKGNVIRNPETEKEKDAMNILNRFVLNMKKMLDKIPFMKSRLATTLMVYNLLKEYFDGDTETLLNEASTVATTLASHSPSDIPAQAKQSFAISMPRPERVVVNSKIYAKIKSGNMNTKELESILGDVMKRARAKMVPIIVSNGKESLVVGGF